MNEVFSSPFFGIGISILAYWIGTLLQKRLKSAICHPLLVAILLVVAVLLLFDIPYDSFNQGGTIINMFLTPATACLAVSIYTKIQILKKNCVPIVIGCTIGSLTSMGSIWLMCRLFGLDEAMTASLIPKSITTPIAVEVCQAHDGIVPVTVIAVIFTGILGSIIAPILIRIFRVRDSIAAGLAIGACSHVAGTSRALEIGETEGAMSGLAIGICGIITLVVSMVLL